MKKEEQQQQEEKEQQQEKEVLAVRRWTCSDLLLRCPQAAWLLTENTHTDTHTNRGNVDSLNKRNKK